MKYYNFGHTNEITIIGDYPQTKRTKKSGYHIDADNSENNVKDNIFPDFIPNYGLDLNPKSIETDLLDRGTLDFGLVVSEKLKEILNEFKLPQHRFYPIDVYNSTNQYFWLHYITRIEEYMEFDKTEIEIFDIFKQQVLETKKFKSFHEILNFNRELIMQVGKTMRYKKICLKSNFLNFDLFEVAGAQNFTLISDALKKRLEKEKVTGFETVEYDKIQLTNTVS